MQQHSTQRRSWRGISASTVVAVLVALALGWLGATLLAAANKPKPDPPPPAPAPVSAPQAVSPAQVAAPGQPTGFAQPAMTPTGLEITSVLTKVKGGVSVTVLAENRSNQRIRVETTSLGPHDVTFRGTAVPSQMAPQTKDLVPGEALVYACRVGLPDMNTGQLSFAVAGVQISGQAAGD